MKITRDFRPLSDRYGFDTGPCSSRGFYFRAFRSPGHPECLPDIATTPN